MKHYSILVNTTDSFEDCWVPFFKLFKTYWPDYEGKIFLNTETKSFSFPGLDVVPICNNASTAKSKISWSECVLRALNAIDDELILYLQDDYFIKDDVKSDIINHYALLMINNNIDCLHLTDQNTRGPFHDSGFNGLKLIDNKALDRISCQAAIWKKLALKAYLQPDESGWQFETYGTQRARYIKHTFLSVDHNIVVKDKYELIPYVFTGIVKGKWLPEVVELFAANHIEIDYSIRGFITGHPKPTFFQRLKAYLMRKPKDIVTKMQILKLLLRRAF